MANYSHDGAPNLVRDVQGAHVEKKNITLLEGVIFFGVVAAYGVLDHYYERGKKRREASED